MKRKPQGQNDIEYFDRIFQAKEMGYPKESASEEIVIFEYKKNQACRRNTDNQKDPFLVLVLRPFNEYPGKIIDHDQDGKHGNIGRDERRIEKATSSQKQHPPKAVRKNEIKGRDHRKENQEFDGIKKHY